MKRFLSFLLVVSVLLFHAKASFATLNIRDIVTKEEITRGVIHKHIKRLTTSGMLDINVIEADLNNNNLAFALLTNKKGVAYLDTVSKLAEENDTVAAINADFFTWVKGTADKGSAIGPEIINGSLKSSTGTEAGVSAMTVDKGNNFSMGLFNMDITITAPNGQSSKLKGINKFDDLSQIMLYNKYFDKMSLGLGEGVIEVVVRNNIVAEVRVGQPATPIPEDGYILASVVDNHFLFDNLHVGDELKLNIDANFNLAKTNTMVGGGAVLVSGGKVPDTFSHNKDGINPRSGVGIDKSGKIVYLVTVDGRQAGSVGLSQREFAELLAELGAYNAMNFDGGGSTTMVVKGEDGQEVVNNPSEGAQRAVINAVGIKSSGKPTGVIEAVAILADDANVFNNTSVGVKIGAYDIYKNKIYVEQKDVAWTVEGADGYVRDGFFYPKSTGTARLTASFGGQHDILNIKVLDNPYSLELMPNAISLKSGGSEVLWLKGYDYSGEVANIYLKDVAVKSDSAAIVASGNKITAIKKGAATLSASFSGVVAYATVGVDGAKLPIRPQAITGVDPIYGKLDKYDMKFTVFGNTGKCETLFDLFVMNTASGLLNREPDNSFAAYVGQNVDKNMLGFLKKTCILLGEYATFRQGGNTFIKLNNKNKTFTDAGQKQWLFIRDTFRAVDTNNIFIFMTNKTLSDGVENKMFYDMIAEQLTDKGKHVYIFTGGEYNESDIKSGVHFITTSGVTEDMVFNKPETIVGRLKYVVVYVGETVRYEYKDVLPKRKVS